MKRNTMVALTLVIIILLSLPASAVVYVKLDSPGPVFDGKSWNTAFHTVQAGINAAISGDEVWVARGVYGGGQSLIDGIALYGGFIGTETYKDQRDWKKNETVIGGTGFKYCPRTTRLDGFTVNGVHCQLASPVIANNTINLRHGSGYPGGGITCYDRSNPLIINNTICNNGATTGGGIYCWNLSSPTIEGNTIAWNTATKGGGIYCNNSSPTIRNNRIMGNLSFPPPPTQWPDEVVAVGGGIYCENGSSPLIYNNTIAGNGAVYGGALYCKASSPTVLNNTVVGNNAEEGGAIYCLNSSPAIANNIVASNSSGIYAMGGAPIVQNNCLYDNLVYDYSGLPVGSGDITVNPKLVSIDYGDLHIQPGSPCIDAGNDSLYIGQTDIDGQARVIGEHVDIGADETDGAEHPAGPYIVVRVKTNGNDANDGSSWQLAKQSIQAAIDTVTAKGGEVWVKAGVYNERIVIFPFVRVYGGFAGSETDRAQRDWKVNASVIDGYRPTSRGSAVYSYTGYMLCAIDGFTIRNSIPGIEATCSSLAIMNNVLSGNFNPISCQYSFSTISDNLIHGNKGSTIFLRNSKGTISGNKITGNAAWIAVGVWCDNSSPIIVNNVIAENTRREDGPSEASPVAILCDNGSSPIISNNTIVNNNAGGIACSDYLGSSSPTISGNIIAFNSWGIGVWNSNPILRNNCIYGCNGQEYVRVSPGLGDISVDPLLADASNGDYHLLPNSPCVNAGWNDAPGLPETDMDGQGRIKWGTVDIGADELWPIFVGIDIHPGLSPNYINLRSRGLTPVAILTADGFDAASVDLATVSFAEVSVASRGKDNRSLAERVDVDLDGDLDLLLRFETQGLIIPEGATSATLTGKIIGGWPIEGVDDVVITRR